MAVKDSVKDSVCRDRLSPTDRDRCFPIDQEDRRFLADQDQVSEDHLVEVEDQHELPSTALKTAHPQLSVSLRSFYNKMISENKDSQA